MNVIPTGRALGAEITGIDLAKEFSAAQREFIFNAYIDNLVLLFRGQSLSFTDLLRLSELFGPPGLAYPLPRLPFEEWDYVMLVDNRYYDYLIRFSPDGVVRDTYLLHDPIYDAGDKGV